ncbi:MAG TPA: sigma-70 family RNA polymerase sigma factor [Frankiaceae bacterium]|nr:sigma-70 family RNA polymerase sigma factor [Frankiaceae bacterium]
MTDLAGVTSATADAFPEFYVAAYPVVMGYAFQLTRDPEAAKDVAQEAFTRLLARWVTVRDPKAYVFHVVTNLVRDTWKARQRRERLVELLGRTADDTVPAPDGDLADAVRRLPRGHAVVVLLFYYSDLPLTEVAAAVRRPEGTVKRMLAEARQRLAITLEDPR